MRVGWKLFLLVLAGAALVQVVVTFFPSWVGLASVAQPIAFNHKKHAGELSLPCTTCHHRAETDVVAGRPPTALCMGCHMAAESKSEEVKKLKAYGEKGQEIPWRRVWRLPSHVFFPHRVHVALAKISCQTCHGPMETLDRPPARALKELTMDDCIGCHAERRLAKGSEKKKVQVTRLAAERRSADCIVCHR